MALLIAASFAPAGLHAQAAPKVRISFSEDSLPNGLHIVYSIDRATPVVAVMMVYDVGSKHEQPGRTGLKPSGLTIVAVGDLKAIEAPVRALNLGTVEVWDNDGNKIR